MPTTKKKPRKAYRPRDYYLSPFGAFQPAPKPVRDALMARFYSSIEAMVRGAHPGEEEWRLLADAINTVETMATHTRNLPEATTMHLVDAAVAAMVGAANRFRAGAGMRVDGPGLEAIRAVLDVYSQCLELLTEREMDKARAVTQKRLHVIFNTRRGEPNVVIV